MVIPQSRFGVIPPNARLLSFAPYYVTDRGLVYSMLTGKFIKSHLRKGCPCVYLKHKDETSHWHLVAKLVICLFVVNRLPHKLKRVGYKDGDKTNVGRGNLYYCL
jgi:hypothetical protein